MDKEQFLQRLRDLPLEECRTYLREHTAELPGYDTMSKWLEDEALHLLYTPFISLKIAEPLSPWANVLATGELFRGRQVL